MIHLYWYIPLCVVAFIGTYVAFRKKDFDKINSFFYALISACLLPFTLALGAIFIIVYTVTQLIEKYLVQ